MALTTCKECGHEVSTQAAACPNCGAKMPKTSGCLVLVLGMVLVLVFASISSSCEQRDRENAEAARRAAEEALRKRMTPEQRDADDRRKAAEAAAKAREDRIAQAKYVCKEFVTKRLHDPDSADFGLYRDFAAEERKDGSVRVQMQVRAKNAFNAKRLGVFDCIVTQRGDRWFPVSITQQ